MKKIKTIFEAIFAGIIIIPALIPNSLIAKDLNLATEDTVVVQESVVKEDIKEPFTKNYDHDDLLVILAEIQDDLENEDLEAAQSKSNDILEYLNYHKNLSKDLPKEGDSDQNVNSSNREILELKYGNWYNSKSVILPFPNLDNRRITYDYLKDNVDLTNFSQNQINRAKIRYITYDIKNINISKNLYNLLSNLGEGNEANIKKSIQDIYENLLKDCDNKISLVTKIRDNLILARHLFANKQLKATENSIRTIDTLIVRLIEINTNNPDEQKKIKNLRKELNNIAKVSDENYIAEWEQVPEEIGEWWKSNK